MQLNTDTQSEALPSLFCFQGLFCFIFGRGDHRFYDSLSRLIEADYNNGANIYNYGYDVAGNLVDYDGVSRTYNAANQMTNDGTNTLTYDNNGNLRTVGSDTYTWDRANRLLSVGNHSYVYDGLGNRVQQTVSSVVTDYLNDLQPGLTKLLKQDDGTNIERFVHAPRGIHAVDDGTDWNFYAQDGLGSVRAVVDDMAVVQTSMSFDPYGNPMGSYGDGFGFTGEQTDANGSVFLRARYYEPSMGVFSALDPLETLNRYSYVSGNPVNSVDPTGLCPEFAGRGEDSTTENTYDATDCQTLRSELRSWGVQVVYDRVAIDPYSLCGLPGDVQRACDQAQSIRQRFTLGEMEAIYNAFKVYRGAYDNLNLARAGIPFPISPAITVEKRKIASDAVDENGIAGLNPTQINALGIHTYPSSNETRRGMILSATRWGVDSNINNMNQQRRSWIVLHEFSHILGKDRTPQNDLPENYQTITLPNLLSQASFSGRLFNPTVYAGNSGLQSEFIIEALTGALWNFGYSAVSGYRQNAGGRTAFTNQDSNNQYTGRDQVFGSIDEGLTVANVRCITSTNQQTLEDWVLANVLFISPPQQEVSDCVRY